MSKRNIGDAWSWLIAAGLLATVYLLAWAVAYIAAGAGWVAGYYDVTR